MTSTLQDIRNIGVIAHIDAGKTTLTERMLFYTQKIHRMGEVHNGTATMDYMPEEQERGITITAACTSCNWQNSLFNIIDTPGHVDFTIEVERSLRVLDGAIAVFCAVGGVEAQSETVWRQSEHFSVPKVVFINKVDRIGADYQKVLEEIQTRLKANAQLITIPYTSENGQEGILHLLDEEMLYFSEEDQGQSIEKLELSTIDKTYLQEKREFMLEKLAEADEEFLELYLSENYTKEDIYKAMRSSTLNRTFIPVFTGSALKNYGVQPLLDGIIEFLPSPLEKKITAHNPKTGQEVPLKADMKEPFTALVFKVMYQDSRKLAFLRIYSGSLEEGDSLYNVTLNDSKDKAMRLFSLHADSQDALNNASGGEIIGVFGLKSARTGDTFTKNEEIILENVNNYQPVLTLALEPRNSEDSKIIATALEKYIEEDPTLHFNLEEATGHFIVSGMGELHLEILLEKLKREYKVEPRSGQPQVIYKEFITSSATASEIFDKELGTIQHYGNVSISIEPYKNDKAENLIRFAFDTATLSQSILDNAYEAAENALSYSQQGYQLQEILLEITHIEKNDKNTPAGVQMAINHALKSALEKVKISRSEPIMKVEITAPEEFIGNSISILSQAGGKIENMLDANLDTTGISIKKIQGKAPLSQLFGFATTLRSATQGRASLIMQFDSFGSLD